MIFYLVTGEHSYTIRSYLRFWGASLQSRIEVLPYDSALTMSGFAPGTYLFADLERLNSEGIDRAAHVADHLERAGLPVLNHPRRVTPRFGLLRTLFERGENRFNAYRLSDTRRPQRFPVFLRLEREHEIVTGLFQNETQLDRAIERNVSEGRSPEELLIVEFCDTSDDAGLFRSYAAFIAGERVIPRHILFGTQWKLKVPDLRDEERLGEQWDYLTAHPHEAWLRRIFAFAGVDYGKIDYSLLDGKPQVWEINTNPVILMPPSQYDQAELPAQELFAERIKSAFEAIDDVPPEGGGFTVVVSPLTPDGDG